MEKQRVVAEERRGIDGAPRRGSDERRLCALRENHFPASTVVTVDPSAVFARGLLESAELDGLAPFVRRAGLSVVVELAGGPEAVLVVDDNADPRFTRVAEPATHFLQTYQSLPSSNLLELQTSGLPGQQEAR